MTTRYDRHRATAAKRGAHEISAIQKSNAEQGMVEENSSEVPQPSGLMRNLAHQFRSDYIFRSFTTSGGSFFASLAFLVFNFALGVTYTSSWYLSISVYYVVLVALRGVILVLEAKWRSGDVALREHKRVRLFRSISWVLLAMDLVLIVPISLMVTSQRIIELGNIPAIALAAYTFYRATFAGINFFRTRKQHNLSLLALRVINLKDTVVAMLTLQYALITVFGDPTQMITLTAYTSAGLLIFMVVVSVLMIRTGKREVSRESRNERRAQWRSRS